MMKADLFTKAQEQRPKPLAAEIRPETLDELIGQQHILGVLSGWQVFGACGRLLGMSTTAPSG